MLRGQRLLDTLAMHKRFQIAARTISAAKLDDPRLNRLAAECEHIPAIPDAMTRQAVYLLAQLGQVCPPSLTVAKQTLETLAMEVPMREGV